MARLARDAAAHAQQRVAVVGAELDGRGRDAVGAACVGGAGGGAGGDRGGCCAQRRGRCCAGRRRRRRAALAQRLVDDLEDGQREGLGGVAAAATGVDGLMRRVYKRA